MYFKYHKSYRGFYLLNGEKFARPFKKIDIEKTAEKIDNKLNISFDKKNIISIPDDYVVFYEKGTTEKKVQNNKINFPKLELEYQVPTLVLENLYSTIKISGVNVEKYFSSVLEIIKNVISADETFSLKVKKIFYYNSSELDLTLKRYNFDKIKTHNLKKEIELNYPKQYISALPVDYKEQEMIFVFYFIVLVELLAVLK